MRLDPFSKEAQAIYPSIAKAAKAHSDDPGAIEPIDICRECWDVIFDSNEQVLIDCPPYMDQAPAYTCWDCGEKLNAFDHIDFEPGHCEICGTSDDVNIDTGLCNKHTDVTPHPCSGINATQAHERKTPYENDAGDCVHLVDPTCTYPDRPIGLCRCSNCPLGGDFWTTHNASALTDTRRPPTWGGHKIDPLAPVTWSGPGSEPARVTFYTLSGIRIGLPIDQLYDELNTYLSELSEQQADLVLEEATDLLKRAGA